MAIHEDAWSVGRARRRPRHAVVAILAAVILVTWAPPATAQDDPTAPTDPIATTDTTSTTDATSTTPTTGATRSAITLDNDQSVKLALVALGFGLVAIALVLPFLSLDRKRSFGLLDKVSKRGQVARAESQAALEQAKNGLAEDAKIQGPSSVVVGQKTNFVVVGTDADVSWAIEGEATISASSGKVTAVTAGAAGGLRLTATLAGGAQSPPPLDLLAEKPATEASTIPFLGLGWGTVVIALAVASVTASLGLTKVLDGQAVAGILGSLVTYSVTRGAATAASGRADPAE